ncbi:hypothetical protein D3C72_2118300 [compost metagenome]
MFGSRNATNASGATKIRIIIAACLNRSRRNIINIATTPTARIGSNVAIRTIPPAIASVTRAIIPPALLLMSVPPGELVAVSPPIPSKKFFIEPPRILDRSTAI